MRLMPLALAMACALPLAAQQPGMGRQRPRMPETWISFDSLSAALHPTEAQAGPLQTSWSTVDSLVRRGAALRTEMREEMQRTQDRDAMRGYLDRLQRLQERVDQAFGRLRDQLTDDQKTALATLRPPRVIPERRGGRGGN